MIVETLNVQRNVGLTQIVRVASLSPDWENYVTELREWLVARRAGLIEDLVPAAVQTGYESRA
ncbi:hypothetical protein D3C75_1336400 [compost metagenome]